MAVRDREDPTQSRHGDARLNTRALLSRPPGPSCLEAAHELDCHRSGSFADRNYNTTVRCSRTRPAALLHDPAEAADRVLRMVKAGKNSPPWMDRHSGRAENHLLHGDTRRG